MQKDNHRCLLSVKRIDQSSKGTDNILLSEQRGWMKIFSDDSTVLKKNGIMRWSVWEVVWSVNRGRDGLIDLVND